MSRGGDLCVGVSGCFCPGGSLSGESLSRGLCLGAFVHEGLSGESLSRGSLSEGLSWGPLSMGSLPRGFCPVGSPSGGLCPGESVSRVGSLCRGPSVQGGLSMESLSGVSVQEGLYQGVFVQWPLSKRSLWGSLPKWSLSGGLCPGEGISIQGSMSRVLGHCPGGYLSRRVSVLGSLFSRISGQVGVSVQWDLSMGSLSGIFCPAGSLSRESLSRGSLSSEVSLGISLRVSVWGLCPGDIYAGGSLSMGSLSMGSLSRRIPV